VIWTIDRHFCKIVDNLIRKGRRKEKIELKAEVVCSKQFALLLQRFVLNSSSEEFQRLSSIRLLAPWLASP